ncbi:hypothetical protein [Candidatus Babela massiliensis]|uniref:Uncharacterized protein n=1 Tax=Candidatus Babela massiliensis TaxID=673862 RepID=V6DF75_9BACT|nr:hypothetical protein [Candidatus Babela massiliensis]CDK30204.1 hypothetical protein BABL1_gene_898 [Candidatus Babela massiliensis]
MARKVPFRRKSTKPKKRYTERDRREVAKQLDELSRGELTKNKNGGEKITSKKAAVAKGLNISDSKKKKKEKE